MRVAAKGVDGKRGQASAALGKDAEGLEEVEVFERNVGSAEVGLTPVLARPGEATGAVTRRKLRVVSLVRR